MITITDSRIEEYLLKLQPEDDPHLQEMEKTAAVCRMLQCGNAVPSISLPPGSACRRGVSEG